VKGAEKGRGVREGGRGVSFMSLSLGPTSILYTRTTRRFSGMAGRVFVKYEYGGRIRGALLGSTAKEEREGGRKV